MNELVQKGIAAFKSGDRPTARKLLATAVQQDMHDVTAWLWLAAVLDKDEERMTCLQRVLQLDPGNQAAAKGLAQILEHRTRAAAETVQKIEPATPTSTPAPANTPTPQAKPTPPSAAATASTAPASTAPAAQPAARPLETPQPASPRIEPQPIPTPTVPPTRVATYTTPERVEQRHIGMAPAPRSEPVAQSGPAAYTESAESELRAEFAAFQPAPEVEAPVGPEIEATLPIKPAVRDEPEIFEPQAYEPTLNETEALAEPAILEGWAAEPAVSVPTTAVATAATAATAGDATTYTRKRKTSSPDVLPTRVIFRTRPSMVPALLCFWLFFFGSVMVGNLLGKIPLMSNNFTVTPDFQVPINTLFAAAMGLLLELVVLYTALRIFTVRYELTNHYLWVHFRGKRARVPLEHIYQAECHQTFIQKMMGTGHLELDLAVHGELAHVRLRNIPDCKKRMDQIMYLVRDIA